VGNSTESILVYVKIDESLAARKRIWELGTKLNEGTKIHVRAS
jgi:hypothetical protein